MKKKQNSNKISVKTVSVDGGKSMLRKEIGVHINNFLVKEMIEDVKRLFEEDGSSKPNFCVFFGFQIMPENRKPGLTT